jgi:hypothetical protein
MKIQIRYYKIPYTNYWYDSNMKYVGDTKKMLSETSEGQYLTLTGIVEDSTPFEQREDIRYKLEKFGD